MHWCNVKDMNRLQMCQNSRPDSPFGGDARNIEIIQTTEAHMREVSFIQSVIVRGVEDIVYELGDTFWLSRGTGSGEDELVINTIELCTHIIRNHSRSFSSSGVRVSLTIISA